MLPVISSGSENINCFVENDFVCTHGALYIALFLYQTLSLKYLSNQNDRSNIMKVFITSFGK